MTSDRLDQATNDVVGRMADTMHELTALICNGPVERFGDPDLNQEAVDLRDALEAVLGRGR